MVHAATLQITATVEWHKVGFAMPGWLGAALTIMTISLVVATIMTISRTHMHDADTASEMMIAFMALVALCLGAILITSGSSLYSTKAANKTNLESTYGVNLSEASEGFLVHGTDTTIKEYKLPDGKITDVTFRVELTELDGATRGKLVTVNEDGSIREVPKTMTLNLDEEVGSSGEEASDTSKNQDDKPNRGSGLKIRDSEVREYLNSVTQSDEIIEKLQSLDDMAETLKSIDERLAKVESVTETLQPLGERLAKVESIAETLKSLAERLVKAESK